MTVVSRCQSKIVQTKSGQYYKLEEGGRGSSVINIPFFYYEKNSTGEGKRSDRKQQNLAGREGEASSAKDQVETTIFLQSVPIAQHISRERRVQAHSFSGATRRRS